MVYSHDGKLHELIQTLRLNYAGLMYQVVTENGKCLFLTEDHLVLTERRVKHLTPSGQWSGIRRENLKWAREMRKAMTPPEAAIWWRISRRQFGVKFRRQHPIGPYIADFYCRECGLVIEIDGAQHYENDQALEYDRRRDAFMRGMGLSVLRFSAHEVGANVEGVCEVIYRKTRQRTLPSDLAKQWILAEDLRAGDVVYANVNLTPLRVGAVKPEYCVEEVYDIHLKGARSYLTDVCAIYNCSSLRD